MNITYLAIENDLAVHKRESRFWKSRGIDSIRVSSMSDAIELASEQQFLYIGINADNVNYKPGLCLLREATSTPIFMATTNYTIQEQTIATKLGADLFGRLGDTPDDNFDAVMTQIQHLNSRLSQNRPPLKFIKFRNILLSAEYRLVLVDDMEVSLTRREFDLLYTLASNRGRTLTFEDIYKQVWRGKEFDEFVIDIIKNAVSRLRNKLSSGDEKYCIIESLRGVGFKCPPQ